MFNKRLLNEMKDEKTFLVMIIILKVVSLFLNIIMIFGISSYISALIVGKAANWEIIVLILAVMIIQVVIAKINAYYSYKMSAEVKRKLRNRLFQKIYGFGMNYSQKVYPAEVMQLSVEGIEQLDMYYGKFIPQLIYSVVAPVILFLVLMNLNLVIALLLFLIVPFIPIAIIIVQRLARKVMSKYWGSYMDLSDIFLDFLNGMTMLKIYGADERQNDKLNELSENFRTSTMKVLSVQLNNIVVLDLIAYGGTTAGIIASLFYYSKGTIDLSSAIIFILISAEFFLPLRLLGSFFHVAMNGMTAADRLFNILDTEELDQGTERLEDENIRISLEDISFGYNEERLILNEISMKFNPGQLVSIVGESGCGKSTVACLVMGSIRAEKGTVTYNGKSNVLDSDRLKKLTMIDNNPYLFKGSVAYNLQMANPKASNAQMWEVLDRLCLKEYFEGEQGLETDIQSQGENLSGGQRQRLAISRALLKDSCGYIFDEATSNIDSESEDIIMNLLEELKKEKTIILISHRLKNTKKSDFIYYMNEGSLSEQGTFDELMSIGGSFKKLYDNQMGLENWGYQDE